MDKELCLALLKLDLQRIGDQLDTPLLENYLGAAASNLAREGVREYGSEDYTALVVGTAAWMYRKRLTGEAEPQYLRRMRIDLKLSGGTEYVT